MNEGIKEKISAMADGELSEFEVRRVLEEVEKDESYRNYWKLLQITRTSMAHESLGNLNSNISDRVKKELNKTIPNKLKDESELWSSKIFMAGSVAAGLVLVLTINFFSTPEFLEDSFSDEAQQKISQAIKSPEAMEVLNNSILGMDATLQKFNYDKNGGILANYSLPIEGKSFKVSMSPVHSTVTAKSEPNQQRVYIKTNKGVFVVSVSGNITDAKKSQILQNVNNFPKRTIKN